MIAEVTSMLQSGPNLRDRLFGSHIGTCGQCTNFLVEPTYYHCDVLRRQQAERGVRTIDDHVAFDTPACGAFERQFAFITPSPGTHTS